jgi:hypothetical protein
MPKQSNDTPAPAPILEPGLGLTGAFLAFMAQATASARAASQVAKPVRPGICRDARNAVAAGEAPARLMINSLHNMTYQRRADEVYALGVAAQEAVGRGQASEARAAAVAIASHEIKGVNTYSKALRFYRDVWAEWATAAADGLAAEAADDGGAGDDAHGDEPLGPVTASSEAWAA